MNIALNIGMRWIMKKEPAWQVGFCCHAHTPTGWGVGAPGLAAQRKHTWYHCSHQTLGWEPLDVTCFPSYWKMSAEESLFLIMGRKRQQREKWWLWSASMLLQVLSLQGLQGLQSSSQADVIQETSSPCQLCLQGSINWKNDRISVDFE